MYIIQASLIDANPSQAKPIQAKPIQAKPSQSKSIWENPSQWIHMSIQSEVDIVQSSSINSNPIESKRQSTPPPLDDAIKEPQKWPKHQFQVLQLSEQMEPENPAEPITAKDITQLPLPPLPPPTHSSAPFLPNNSNNNSNNSKEKVKSKEMQFCPVENIFIPPPLKRKIKYNKRSTEISTAVEKLVNLSVTSDRDIVKEDVNNGTNK